MESASPVGLVVLLYDGAIQAMSLGKEAIISRQLEEQNRHLQKAQRIVGELTATLNIERGGEVAQNLLQLYNFVYDRLVQANIEDAPERIDEALLVMSQLRESWAALDEAQRQPQAVEAA